MTAIVNGDLAFAMTLRALSLASWLAALLLRHKAFSFPATKWSEL